MLNEHRPIDDVAKHDAYRSKVSCSMTQQEECVAVGIRTIDGVPLHYYALWLGDKFFEACLDIAIRAV